MATLRLGKRRVDTLKPHKSAYDVRDRELKGFGVRILPSGAKRYFIHSQHHGRRVWKIVGQAGSIGVDEARDRARVMLALIRNGTDEQAAAPQDTAFEIVGDEVFRRYARNWKPSTLKVNQNYYRNHILPWFEGRPIGDIAAHDVRRWFASLHNTPVSADRSAPILSVIMRQAEVYGYRPEGTNPCAGIRRYRRQGRERFLSTAEIRRLGEVLARQETDHPQATAIIRLLLLTGCRKGESHHPEMALLPRGQAVPARQQDGAAHDLAFLCRARGPRQLAPHGSLGLPLAPDGRLSNRGGGRSGLVSRASGSGPVRSPPSRSSSHLREHGVGTGRDGADHRPAAGTSRSGNDAQVHPPC